jgi:hypothetical protein
MFGYGVELEAESTWQTKYKPVPEVSLWWPSYLNLISLSLENLATRAIFLLVILGELSKRLLHIRPS